MSASNSIKIIIHPLTINTVDAVAVGASIQALGNIILMLANSTGTKEQADDPYWAIFTEDVNSLVRGVRMKVQGIDSMVFAFILFIAGDTPGIKRMMGFSSSSTLAKRPCRICMIRREHLADVDCELEIRDPNIMQTFFRRNEFRTGVPSDINLQIELEQLGMKRCPEIGRYLGVGDCRRLVIDGLHFMDRGMNVTFLRYVMMVLSSGPDTPVNLMRDKAWVKASSEFTSYCKTNRIAAFAKFSDENTFDSLNGASVKEFVQCSPYIFLNIGLVAVEPSLLTPSAIKAWQEKTTAFVAWCMHVKVAEILNRHTITPDCITMLQSIIPVLQQYWSCNCPQILHINAHYLRHVVELIRCCGPPRTWSNYTREGYIGRIKPLYKNTNHKHVEESIFNRYIYQVMKEMIAVSTGQSESVYKRYIIFI